MAVEAFKKHASHLKKLYETSWAEVLNEFSGAALKHGLNIS